MSIDELDDAIDHIARGYRVTGDEVLSLIESHGLERAAEKIAAAVRGEV